MSTNDGAQKLAVVFKPMLDEMGKSLREVFIVHSQEVLLAIGKLETRLDVLEKLVGEKKKSTVRGDKKVAGATEVATGNSTANPGEVQVQQPAGTTKNFPVNKLVYFREQYKTNPDYRTKYVTEDIKKLMDADQTITSKNNEAQKLVAQATYCWNYFKTVKPEVGELIDKEFTAAKAKYEADNKSPQQTVEAKTPPQ